VKGRLPRYHRIAEELRERIRGGEWGPGAALPNQRRLAHAFGVTLMTLRQALELLERDHLITRRHGLGTFVAAPTIDYEILKLRRFAGELLPQDASVTTRALDARPAVVDRRASLALGLSPRACTVLTSDLTETSLKQVLEFKLGLVIVRAREAVSAVRLGPREARELACTPGTPAFESERVSFDAAGQPVVFDRVFIPGDRFRITRDLHYDSAQSRPEDVRGAITS
jgi:GntR family transcriptional regulator